MYGTQNVATHVVKFGVCILGTKMDVLQNVLLVVVGFMMITRKSMTNSQMTAGVMA